MDRERTVQRERTDWPWEGMRASDVATAWGELANDMAAMFDALVDTWAPQDTRARRQRRRSHRPQRKLRSDACTGCAPSSCHCDCCVYDADLVVYARYGEFRVVPVRISNERTRERLITLDLSDFRTSGGRPAPVNGEIGPSQEFTLEACERQDVILTLRLGSHGDSLAEWREEHGSQDVDGCLVAYADLRIHGCDVRPVRIAVAISPRDCDAYEVHCACGCC